jgi:hypothetical protein
VTFSFVIFIFGVFFLFSFVIIYCLCFKCFYFSFISCSNIFFLLLHLFWCIFSFCFSLFFLCYILFLFCFIVCVLEVFFFVFEHPFVIYFIFLKKKVKEVLVCWQQNIDAYFDGMSFLKGDVVMLKNQNAS